MIEQLIPVVMFAPVVAGLAFVGVVRAQEALCRERTVQAQRVHDRVHMAAERSQAAALQAAALQAA